jgi:GTP-binding protein
MAVQDAMRAMKTADVAVLVLDAEARMLHRHELAIMDAILREGRALVVAANKMDLIVEHDYSREEFEAGVRDQLEGRFPMLRKTPIVAMSSLTGDCVHELMPVVFQARDRWARTISTGELNRWIFEVMQGRKPPTVAGKVARIKYMIQTKGRPPTFLLFCNTDQLPDSYLRYLTRNFQDSFEMFGMEVRLAVKKSAESNPYEPTKKRGGSGIGGKEARKQRAIRNLKTTGKPRTGRRRKLK